MKVFLFLAILLLTLLVINCKQPVKRIGPKAEVNFFDPIVLGAFNRASNLSFKARFSECGEWGGHLEQVTIFADSTKSIHARYRVYPYNCDSLKYYFGNEDLNPTIDKISIVGDKEKQAIVDYIERLTKAKIKESALLSNAGDVFSIVNFDSTLIIQVADNKEENVASYKRFVTDLFK